MIDTVDWPAVERAIGEAEDYLDFEYEAIKDAVAAAADAWLPEDAQHLVVGVEQEVEIPYEGWEAGELPPESARRAKGIVDLNLLTRQGRVIIVDWKTTGAQDMPQAEKYSRSWQWRMYVAAAVALGWPVEAVEVQYRVITRSLQLGTITLQPTAETVDRVTEQLRMVARMNEALEEFTVWPQRMPGACKAYGRDCPFTLDCAHGTMPRGKMPRKDLSFTYVDRFLLCPERARRVELEPEGDATDEAGFGKAFHRGMAEVYGQLQRRRTNGTASES